MFHIGQIFHFAILHEVDKGVIAPFVCPKLVKIPAVVSQNKDLVTKKLETLKKFKILLRQQFQLIKLIFQQHLEMVILTKFHID